MKPLDKVIELVGGRSALAKRLKTTPQHIYMWIVRGTPPERWFELSDTVDGRVAAREFYEEWRQRKASITA